MLVSDYYERTESSVGSLAARRATVGWGFTIASGIEQ